MKNIIETIKKKLEKNNVKFEKIQFLAGDASNRKYFTICHANRKKVLIQIHLFQ